MAQAIPISHQQKTVASPSSAGWGSSSMAHDQSSQQQRLSNEPSENSSIFQSNIFCHRGFPVTSATISSSMGLPSERGRVASATIPRQQKHQHPSLTQSASVTTSSQIFSGTLPNRTISPDHNSRSPVGQRGNDYESSMDNEGFNRKGSSVSVSSSLMDGSNQTGSTATSTLERTPSTGTTTMVILNADSVVTTAEEDGLTMVTVSGIGGTVRSSPMSDSKWTSFDDSEADGDETSSRHNSESEHQNLLADVDATSDAGDDTTTLTGSVVIVDDEDRSWTITAELRKYYQTHFDDIRRNIVKYNAGSNEFTKHLEMAKTSSPIASGAASSPVDVTSSGSTAIPGQNPAAIWGKHPLVKEFFEISNLTKSELGQIWALADVNADGWLNFDEFCVAMHLVVRCVQAGLPVPNVLPLHIRPLVTPPIVSPGFTCGAASGNGGGGGGAAGVWAQFDSSISPGDQQTNATKQAILNNQPYPTSDIPSVIGTGDSQVSSPPATLKDFTNIPPTATADHTSRMSLVQPKPRRVTPEFHTRSDQQQATQYSSPARPTLLSQPHSSSVPPVMSKFTGTSMPTPRPRTSTNDRTPTSSSVSGANQKVQSEMGKTNWQSGGPPPAVPKGPPPKPPPRPMQAGSSGHRHNRSVSLDLSKQINDMQHQFTTTNNKATPVSQEFVSPMSASSEMHTPNWSTTQQTIGTTDGSMVKREWRDAQIQTVITAEDWQQHHPNENQKRQSIAPMLDLSMDLGDETPRAVGTNAQTQNSTKNQNSSMVAGETGDDSKDWTKRCERLRRLNGDLERDLKKLSEVRIGLEMHLKRLQKL